MKFLSEKSADNKRTAAALGIAVAALAMPVATNAADWTGSTPSAANNKTVYLYNVGAKKFLGNGERWGTMAVTTYEGTPFTLTYSSSKIILQSQVKGQGSSTNGYLAIMDGVSSVHDKLNYFTDRPSGDGANRQITATKVTTDDGSTVYRLTFTPTQNSGSSFYNKTYYMASDVDDTVTSLTSVDDDTDNYSEWIIVTEEERKNAFLTAEAANAKPVNATFLMYDFDFARNNQACKYWKTGADQSGTLSWNTSAVRIPTDAQGVTYYTHTYTNTHSATYTTSSGTESTSRTSHTATYTVTNTLTPEEQKEQTPTITASCGGDSYTSGWYQTTYTHEAEDVEFTYSSSTKSSSIAAYTYYLGNGYTDSDVETGYDPITGEEISPNSEKNRQCAYGSKWTANIHGSEGYVTQTLESANMLRNGYYRVSCKAFTTATTGKVRLWAAASSSDGNGSADEQDSNTAYAYKALPAITENIPATYADASDLINDLDETAYDASVMVYVSDITSKQLTFGIYVNGADATAWTCFDSFALQYLGDPEHDLVLDEDQTDGKYINAQATPDNEELKTSNLYLHRTMNAGKWNSLVLPVDLTVAQVKAAFGDQVRISQFDGATDPERPTTIIFKKINVNRDNDTETAIKAGELYLVKVDADKTMPTGLEAKSVEGYDWSITDYYTITGVTYMKKADADKINYNTKLESKEGAEIYTETNQIKFVGTYVKLQQDDYIPAKSYVLNGNNQGGTAGVWYYRTVPTPSKGFRGWLQNVDGSDSESLTYDIDGVEETVNGSTDGIAEIVNGNPEAIKGDVYTLNGQLVKKGATSLNGLQGGIYIVGGKKVVK